MSLFTDGTPADIEYLRTYESSIQDMAVSERIDLKAKLALTASDIGDQIFVFMRMRRSGPGITPPGLDSVVISGALRRWHATATLTATYSDGFSSQLNDRYQAKRDEYRRLTHRARERYFAIGVGVVNTPIPKAGLPAGGSDLATQRFFVKITWADAAGHEGAPSDSVGLDLIPGSLITPPLVTPPGIAWWNIYMGDSLTSLQRQNSLLIPAGSGWAFGGTLSPSGIEPGAGQEPDYFIVDHRGISRG